MYPSIEFDLGQIEETSNFIIAGCDEVGRGPLAGPVVACTVQAESKGLSDYEDLFLCLCDLGLTDSKKLTKIKRQDILTALNIDLHKLSTGKKNCVNQLRNIKLSFFISQVSAEKIEKINILNASLEAMANSFNGVFLKNNKTLFLIDGNKLPSDIPSLVDSKAIVKGDSKSAVIALASVIAKEYRDNLMIGYAKKYPNYGFEQHSGYPTLKHRLAIEKWGISPIHRKSFKGVKEYVSRDGQ
ncbi:MAG: ribonuclease HII [Halobacteriovoraceae bacterium]|jgi:ribonuclease HII|nr:ribonuclease HII [Halobacteriovoraceae bacterium]